MGPNLTLAEGKVNGKDCTVMRDPGSVVSVVASYLVKPKQKLNKILSLELINGFKCKHRVAKIQVEDPCYNDILEMCIIDVSLLT